MLHIKARYSQNDEDSVIGNYFGLHVGTFLDIGANDGYTLSNTWALHSKGWAGVLVEASPLAFARLQENYKGLSDDLIHAAVTDFNGEITLHESGEHLGKGDVSLLSTVVPAEKERWVKESFTEVTVPAINFATMLGLAKSKQFDFISMDIEGAELQVLPQMDLQALGCKLLCVEYNGQRQPEFDAIVLPQGYKLIHKNGENLIYSKI
jgi:FkbM family methyltransferase